MVVAELSAVDVKNSEHCRSGMCRSAENLHDRLVVGRSFDPEPAIEAAYAMVIVVEHPDFATVRGRLV